MKNWSEIPTGKVLHFLQQFIVALGDNAESVITKGNSDEAYIRNLAEDAIAKATPPTIIFELSPSQKRAQEIMGSNFFGVAEAIKHFGINPTQDHVATLAEVPFTKEVLMSCKNTHILVAVLPLSILDIKGIVEKNAKTLFRKQAWYENEIFANASEISWQLVRKNSIFNSTSKTWQDQCLLLSQDEKVPTAQVLVYTVIGHFLDKGECLFEDVYAHTSTTDSRFFRVSVGHFNAEGLLIHYSSYNDLNKYLALASARK